MSDTLDVLIRARAEVEKGWVQFRVNTPDGVCAVGGLVRAMPGRFVIGSAAYNALCAALPGRWINIGHFNDDHRTTKMDVLALYDRAITAEAVKVTADTAHTFATVS